VTGTKSGNMSKGGTKMRLSDISEALGLLTRLPVRLRGEPRGSQAAWAYPLAGLAVGGLGALVAFALQAAPPALSAGLALAAMIIVTGALHEDGLADTADGLWGGWTRARRLEIMKDSRIGTNGVLALVLATLLRWVALAALIGAGWIWAVVAVAVASRAPMVVVMAALPNARGDGLSASTGRPSAQAALVALAIGGVALLALGWAGLWGVAALVAAATAVALIARAKIGGQTGDILGATQQISEIAALATLAALAA
jgi:adenosylcobinamide-GDP ribazoletransferase